ncbi:DUF1353 domain-containing protein [Pseudomonas panipatensis]|uniref:DUF1353 domain-containing protein n=1 Tax=Pseudomonas panipatensis TaxID=428992 RepID=A0A1G8LEE5_9PSED|nr:DUF1353 domain-containing protein [Pseudomonas panipatensis]SDI53847.1 Protein of unknown function [Pseudomonas panipatensis]SMP75092.1 Protein of unknown function [Pseudomonas panipatensis]
MSRFLTTLKTEQLGKWNHRLLADLVLEDDLGTFTAPAGFETNFASLQVLHNAVLFVFFALVAGYGNLAATIHDQLYTAGQLPRKDCDAVFYRALRAEGVAAWRAWIMWAGVRIGGASHYTKTRPSAGSSVSGGQ